jgi:uncharacterized protein
MSRPTPKSYVAFAGPEQVARGDLRSVALATKALLDAHPERPVSIFDDATGRVVDLDPRGTPEDVVARLPDEVESNEGEVATGAAKRGRGRPRLGVVSKEVTLLPRHWAWLGAQRGSVSATLRRLVDEARRTHERRDAVRGAQDAAYRFMAATLGNEPSFEDAIRALYRGDETRFASATEGWPPDLREHGRSLATEAFRVPAPSPHTSAPERR